MRVAELEGLQFQISASSDNASQHLNALAESLGRLRSAASNLRTLRTATGLIQDLSNATDGLKADGLSRLADALSRLNGLSISATAGRNFSALVDQIRSLTEGDIGRIERLADAYGYLSESTRNLRLPRLPRNLGDEQPQQNRELPNERRNNGVRELLSQIDDLSSRSAPAFSRAISEMVSSLRSLATGSDGASRGLRGILKYTVGLPLTLGSGFASKIGGATKSLGHLFSAIKRIALYRLIRAVIKEITQGLQEGIKNIYAYSNALGGEFAAAMDSLATSSLYLKNSLGALAAPIIQSLIPAINWAIDRIVALMNVINMFVAALGGKATATVAKRVETAFNAAGSAAGGAAGAAKKALKDLKTYTIGIDELNIIDDKDKAGSGSGGGGGGGAGGIDPSSMFEEVDINKGISDFATKLKNAIKAQKWDQVGKILGDEFNNIVQNKIKWDDIGASIGSKLSAAITIGYNFIKTADTYTLGEKIADFFSSGISRVNTDNLGKLLVSVFTKGIDFLIGFSLNMNMREVAQKINDFLKGAFNEAREWLGGRDWFETGSKLRKQITEFLKGIDWDGIWEDLVKFLKSLGHSVLDLMLGLLNIDGQKTQNALGKFFSNVFTLGGYANVVEKDGNYYHKQNIHGSDGKTVNYIPLTQDELDKWGLKNKNALTVPITPVVQNDSKQWKSDLGRYWENGVNNTPVASFATNLRNDSDHWLTDRNTWWTQKNNRNPVASFVTNLKDDSIKWITTRNTAWNSKNGTPVAPFTTNVKKEGNKWRTDVENEWSKNTPTLRSNVGVKFDGQSAWNQVKTSWDKYAGTLTTKIGLKTPIVEAKTTKLPTGLEVPTWSIKGWETKWGAKGGILEKAALIARKGSTLIGAGEAGREALLPLDQNTGWMDTIAEKVRDTMATAANYEYSGMDKILSRLDAIEAMLGSVDDNTRIQAEKPSNTYVNISGRAVRDAVVRQTNADGYSFA